MPAHIVRTITRLTAAGLVAITASGRATAQQPQTTADRLAIENYKLSMAVLNRLAQVQANMYATVRAHPELAKKYATTPDADENAATLDDMAKTLDRLPAMKAAVIKAGFTPREYMLATMVTIQAAMTALMFDMPGADRSKLSANAQANAAFMKSHAAELMRMQARSAELQKLVKQQSGVGTEANGSAEDTSGSRH